jgi:hypothetical protein
VKNLANTRSHAFAGIPCEAGGASYGAVYANLHHDEYACEIYHFKLLSVTCYRKDANEVASISGADLRCDMVTISLLGQAYF